MTRIKFQNEGHAAEMMVAAIEDGFAKTWTMTKAGYVRFLCARSNFWLDLNEATFKAWKYSY